MGEDQRDQRSRSKKRGGVAAGGFEARGYSRSCSAVKGW
jgi:hypothetical protein